MKPMRVLAILCLIFGSAGLNSTSAQFPRLPKIPGIGGAKDDNKKDNNKKEESPRARGKEAGNSVNPPGVPVPMDSPLFDAFRKLEQQSVYHQRITMTANDPQMQQMMAQMGFMPTETTVAGDTKQVSMHFKLPVEGQQEDFELRAVSRNGVLAKKWLSPAKDRILAKQDASIASQLAQSEAQSSSSIARSLATGGPLGAISAGVQGAAAAANVAEAASLKKQAHDFWEWSCMDGEKQAQAAAQARREPPPLTDLRVVGDDSINGTAVTTYEFYVKDGGKFHGPMQMHIAKDSGLPLRMGMNDPTAGGSMQMDYFGFNQGGDFEVPSCVSK